MGKEKIETLTDVYLGGAIACATIFMIIILFLIGHERQIDIQQASIEQLAERIDKMCTKTRTHTVSDATGPFQTVVLQQLEPNGTSYSYLCDNEKVIVTEQRHPFKTPLITLTFEFPPWSVNDRTARNNTCILEIITEVC